MNCELCSASLEYEDGHWECTGEHQAGCKAKLCEACFFEDGHGHTCKQVKATFKDGALFRLSDPVTGNSVVLGNCACAVPGSGTLQQHDIRSVLTLLVFEEGVPETCAELATLRDMYGARNTLLHASGVRYHRIAFPDVTSPERLPATQTAVLEEATCFVDAALQKGNVLIHCQYGEKRSPTVLLAWMATRGYRIMDAIELVDKEYAGKSGWGDVYKRTRKEWIEELKQFSRSWQERQLKWSQKIRVTKVNEKTNE